jgi:hypothetical protein
MARYTPEELLCDQIERNVRRNIELIASWQKLQ